MGGDLVLLFGASVLGSAHCVAMCGPYVAMCTAQFVPRGPTAAARCGLRVLFNLGRIATYSLIGLIVGAFGQIAQELAGRFGVTGITAIAAGFMIRVIDARISSVENRSGCLAAPWSTRIRTSTAIAPVAASGSIFQCSRPWRAL